MKSFVCALAAAATVVGLQAFAQETPGEGSEASAQNQADEKSGALAEVGGAVRSSKSEAKFFYTLPTVKRLVGAVEVLKPGATEWIGATEGLYYPLGSSFRTLDANSRLTVAFGRECRVVVAGQASFGTRAQGLGEKSRAVLLQSGIIAVKLPRALPEGLFSVCAPGFTVVNPAGDSIYRYEKTGDGDKATIRCVTGSLAVDGRHFRIVEMHAANEVMIQTSQDVLFTGIFGRRGEYYCKLDQGLVKNRDVETGEARIEPKYLDWKISPQTAVRIQRAVPKLGKNLAVSVMTFDASGALKNRCAFTENRFEVNTGEIAPTSKGSQAELAKKAAEATSDVSTVDVEESEEDAEDEDVTDITIEEEDVDLNFN